MTLLLNERNDLPVTLDLFSVMNFRNTCAKPNSSSPSHTHVPVYFPCRFPLFEVIGSVWPSHAITIPTTHECTWQNTCILNKITGILCQQIFCVHYYVYTCRSMFKLSCKCWKYKNAVLDVREDVCSIVLLRNKHKLLSPYTLYLRSWLSVSKSCI